MSTYYPSTSSTRHGAPGAAAAVAIMSSKVEISVSCKNLIDKDVLSKSDPMVVLFTEERGNNGKFWKEHSRTEVIQNNLNPQFVTPFKIDYHFEQQQNLKFEVYDSDSSSSRLMEHDYLGHTIISLGNIMGEFSGVVSKPLMSRDNRKLQSTITFMAEEMSDSKEVALIQFNGKKLDKKDFFGSSDPFLVLYRHAVEDNRYMPVHKTEKIMNNLNPSWKAFEVPLSTLCNGDKSRPIKIECYDWNSSGSHDLIGACEVTVDEMLAKTDFPRPLVNPKKQKKKKDYKNSGELNLIRIELRKDVSFLDYITGGLELCFHVAIDFTASNGVPSNPSSLHFMRQDAPNLYAQALLAVGKICEDYDSDKLMPAYGFGARINGTVYHNFHLNQTQNPDCYGVMGILEAYQRFLSRAELYGPTNFSPVINLVTNIAQQQSVVEKYHILLILTDGVITDMDRTKSAIINASHYPVSIIIVGVGNADFEAMDELDCDSGRLRHNGYTAEQDIVQFVPYNKYSGHYASDDLAKEVLHEVPTQLVNFMKSHGYKPGPKRDIYPGIEVPVASSTHPQQYGDNSRATTGAPPPYPHQPGPPSYSNQQGPAPYPNQPGSAPYPNQPGSAPYPNQPGSVPYSNQPGSAPYPNQPGSAPYPNQPGSAPYPNHQGPPSASASFHHQQVTAKASAPPP